MSHIRSITESQLTFEGLTEKEQMINGMMIINTLSLPFRAIDRVFEDVYKSGDAIDQTFEGIFKSRENTELTSRVFIGEKAKVIVEAIVDLIPESSRSSVRQFVEQIREDLPRDFQKKYDISQDETLYCIESTQQIVEGLALSAIGGVAGKTATASLKAGKNLAGKVRAFSSKDLYRHVRPFEGTETLATLPWKKIPESIREIEPYYFHATHEFENLLNILKSKAIQARDSGYRQGSSCFVSTHPEISFGDYILALNRKIEHLPAISTHRTNIGAYWTSFSRDIPVNAKTLEFIAIPTKGLSDHQLNLISKVAERKIPVKPLEPLMQEVRERTIEQGLYFPAKWPMPYVITTHSKKLSVTPLESLMQEVSELYSPSRGVTSYVTHSKKLPLSKIGALSGAGGAGILHAKTKVDENLQENERLLKDISDQEILRSRKPTHLKKSHDDHIYNDHKEKPEIIESEGFIDEYENPKKKLPPSQIEDPIEEKGFVDRIHCNLHFDLEDSKNTAANISFEASKDIKVGVQFNPLKPKNTIFDVSNTFHKSESGNLSAGLLITPTDLKNTKVTINFNGKKGNPLGGAIIDPRKPMHSEVMVNVPVGYGVTVGGQMQLNRPQDIKLNAGVGITSVLGVGASLQPRRPENLSISVSIPGCGDIANIKLKTILKGTATVAKKTAKEMDKGCKKTVNTTKKTIIDVNKGFKKTVNTTKKTIIDVNKGFKKFVKAFKYKRKAPEIVYVEWTPSIEERKLAITLQIAASEFGYIPSEVAPEIFFNALVGDWQEQRQNLSFHAFLLEVKDLIENGKIYLINCLCPRSISSIPAEKAKLIEYMTNSVEEILEIVSEFLVSDKAIAEEVALIRAAKDSRNIGLNLDIDENHDEKKLIDEMNRLLHSI